MEFIISKFDIDSSLAVVKQVIDKRSDEPVLTGVKIEARILPESGKGIVEFSATNLENSILIKSPAQVTREGKVIVNAARLTEVIRVAEDGNIRLYQNDKGPVNYQAGKTRGRLNTLEGDLFPDIVPLEWADVEVSSSEFITALTMAIISAAKNNSGNVLLESVHAIFERDTASLRIESTDSYRLSKSVIGAEALHEDDIPDVVIPATSFSLIKSTINNLISRHGEDDRRMYLSFPMDDAQNKFVIDFGRATLFLSAMSGNYPDIRISDWESGVTTIFECDTYELYHCSNTSEVFARDNFQSVLFKIEKNGAVMMAESPTHGSSKMDLDGVVEFLDDISEFEITFNIAYLIHVLKVIKSPRIKLGMINKESPIFIRPVYNEEDGEEDDVKHIKDFVYVMLPQNRQAISGLEQDDDAATPHYLREEE